MMKIKILGSGTAVPSLKRGSSSYLVSVGNYNILVDAGPSVVRRLLEYGHTVDDVDAVFLTHFHVDHTADLSTFMFACNYGAIQRTKPLLIAGGKGIHKFYSGLLKIYPWILPKSYDLQLYGFRSNTMKIGDVSIQTAKVNHNKESIGVRFEDEKSIVFSGDTDYSRNLIKLSYMADLLVVDCAFPERKVKGHLNLSVLKKIVDRAQPRRVVVSHLYPEWDDFRGVLHAPYLMAEDGMEIEL
jgi:ribonuclease BN (tRNA processing enzyme)